jgi:uncharacterized protein DUF6624
LFLILRTSAGLAQRSRTRANTTGLAQRARHAHAEIMNESMRAELLRRADVDQAARNARDPVAMERADAENLRWLKQVIAEGGWPGRSAVGDDGASAAWLLAQHADCDPAFQRQCLTLLAAAVEASQAKKADLAYLTDRVLLAEGQPQEYGTQVMWRNRRCVPRDLRDPDHVDERRAAMLLEPLAEYLTHFIVDGAPAPVSTRCIHCGERVSFWPPDPGELASVDCAGCGRTLRIGLGPRLAPGR